MNDLTTFYHKLLDMCGIELDGLGRLSVKIEGEDGDETFHLKVLDMPVVFPDKSFLKLPENTPDKTITFHPLSESIVRGVSEVQTMLMRAAIVRINTVGGSILNNSIDINYNATADESYKLNHKQNQLFADVSDNTAVDEKFIKWWNKITEAMIKDPKYRLFDLTLVRSSSIEDKQYQRVAVISSPLWDAIHVSQNKDEVFGVKVERKKDLAILTTLLKSLFPDLQGGGYKVGSSEEPAPYLQAFVGVMITILTRFNSLLSILGAKMDKDTRNGLHSTGMDLMENVNLDKIRNLIPPDKKGNVGIVVRNSSDVPEKVTRSDVDPKRALLKEAVREQPKVEEVEDRPAQTESRYAKPQQPKPANSGNPSWQDNGSQVKRISDRFQQPTYHAPYGAGSGVTPAHPRFGGGQQQPYGYQPQGGYGQQGYGYGQQGNYGGYGNQGGYGQPSRPTRFGN